MGFREMFDVFSRRDIQVKPVQNKITQELRNKIFLYCRDRFNSHTGGYAAALDQSNRFWDEIHRNLQYLYGKVPLSEGKHPENNAEDTIRFLVTCKDEEFCDFIEYIFKTPTLAYFSDQENLIVAEINDLLASENAGYELTKMVKERVTEISNHYMFRGQEASRDEIISFPQIIRKDDQIIHANAIKPALDLLIDSKFKSANKEYLEALEDYKKKDYGDCLTKCCSAFESVMKIICDEKGWAYKQTNPAGDLLKIIFDKTNLDPFFKDPLLIIATLRNRLSKSHGAGTQIKVVSQNKARYALNATASAIVFLVEETK